VVTSVKFLVVHICFSLDEMSISQKPLYSAAAELFCTRRTLTPSSELQGDFLVDSAEDHNEDEIQQRAAHAGDRRRLSPYDADLDAMQRYCYGYAIHYDRDDTYQHDKDLRTYTPWSYN